ncbi:MAG: energy-coupling factor ABC transporter ATP-binding protein [Lachnospiraceae bacterium]|nr:energy-coupling factor ABC transporter ATP-binding protein [Lachnospiraceae bacterium]
MGIISIGHLKYRYPGMNKLALDDINVEIEQGEIIGVIGRSGSGKSTLAQALIGLVPNFYRGAYGGRVRVGEKVVRECPVEQMCEDVGMIFQNPFTQLSGAKDNVYGEVAYGLQNLGIPRDEIHRRVEKVLKKLGIWEYREKNPFLLSGGQMQRVAIASMLVMNPKVMIFDEPTSQLDPRATKEIFSIVEDMAKEGKTIIIVEQKIELMARHCDKLLVLEGGKCIAFGKTEEVLQRTDLGIAPPIYVRIAREHNIKTAQGRYPITAEEFLQSVKQKVNLSLDEKRESYQAEEVFRIQGMDFSYVEDSPIFSDFSLSLDARSTAIVGENGAGKTTLVKLLKGLLSPQKGDILYGRENIKEKTVASLAKEVGYVFQNPDDQIFQSNVLQEVMFGPKNLGMKNAEEMANEALEMVGLSHQAQANPYDLSLQERKMIAIASVIAMDPKVMILDEPTIAQDSVGKDRIANIIKVLRAKGKCVIAILHDMDFVLENFERVMVLFHGKILAEGEAEEVFCQDEILQQAKLEKPYRIALKEKIEEIYGGSKTKRKDNENS